MYSMPSVWVLLVCVAMGFVGSLLWAVWSRAWDWWVETATEDARSSSDTLWQALPSDARTIETTASVDMRFALYDARVSLCTNALAERLDKIEDIVYNTPKTFDTVREFQSHAHQTATDHAHMAELGTLVSDQPYAFLVKRVPYASKNTCGGPVDPPTCW